MYISNAPSEKLSIENFRKLYSIRWQIELIFKNWKSNFSIDEVTGIRKERIKCMIYAKLLMTIINMRITFWVRNYVWLNKKREISEFRLSKQLIIIADTWLKLILTEPEKLEAFLKQFFDFVMKNCLKEKQKNRTYPLDILEEISNTKH